MCTTPAHEIIDCTPTEECLVSKHRCYFRTDTWGNAFRLEHLIDEFGNPRVVISSAGPDGVHDTRDDIVSARIPKRRR